VKLVTYSRSAERRIGFLANERVCDLYDAAAAANVEIPRVADLRRLANVDHLPALRRLSTALGDRTDDAWSFPARQVKLHTPYRPAQNVLIAGGNTRDDFVAQRMRAGRPMLRYHTKAPSAIVDPGEPLKWPRQVTSQVHAEPHIALVMGRRIAYAPPAEALKYVFGYTVATNVNGYDLKRKHGQWDKAVSLDTFFPWGPVIATADEVSLETLVCRLWLNERMALSGAAESGLMGTAALLSEISFGMSLEPGDVVLTGTAEGVGHGEIPERWLQDGDRVRSGIAGICEIENPVATY
jgi:2-keto-4-pentenoate hydratase/2-oxohepta-3-ene-1,7-dioic acid hydratase in catechol pathway